MTVTKHCHSPCDTETAETIGDVENVLQRFDGMLSAVRCTFYLSNGMGQQSGDRRVAWTCPWPLETTPPEPHFPPL